MKVQKDENRWLRFSDKDWSQLDEMMMEVIQDGKTTEIQKAYDLVQSFLCVELDYINDSKS